MYIHLIITIIIMILNSIEHVYTIQFISIIFTIKECACINSKLELHKIIVYFLIYIYIYMFEKQRTQIFLHKIFLNENCN